MSRFEVIRDYIKDEMDDDSIVRLYRDYCEENNCYDDIVYSMDDFDEQLESFEPWEIACRIFYGNFNPRHEYFKWDGYGNLKSFYNAYEVIQSEVDIDAIAEYIDENDDELYNDDLQEILDNYGNNYNRRAVEEEYGLEDGELDDCRNVRDAEHYLELEDGELDRFIVDEEEEDEEE